MLFKNTKILNMSKWLMLVFFTFIVSNTLWAQQNRLEIKGTGTSIYIEHVVTPKENFYSVGRKFNVNPKELASFNHLHFASGLNIGQVLKIPLSKNNFTQQEIAAANEALIPVYHTVAAGETLYRLGVNYNKVSLASLKSWNHLTSDALSVGMPMIIGFLKVDKEQSPLANEHQTMAHIVAPEPAVIQQATVTQKSDVKGKDEQESAEVKPAKTQTAQLSSLPVSQTQQPPASEANNGNLTVTPTSTGTVSTDPSTGYFKNLYERQINNKTTIDKNGTAGIFKSTSGWQDAKYYCFSNDAGAGTILKITNTSTGKSVYAKVLDAIPDISQNDGLLTVISNAAAEQLGAGTDKFDCTVTFAKQ